MNNPAVRLLLDITQLQRRKRHRKRMILVKKRRGVDYMEAAGYRETLAMLSDHFGKMSISLKEYANYLNTDRHIVQQLIESRKLPGNKVGGRWNIPVTQIALHECKKASAK